MTSVDLIFLIASAVSAGGFLASAVMFYIYANTFAGNPHLIWLDETRTFSRHAHRFALILIFCLSAWAWSIHQTAL